MIVLIIIILILALILYLPIVIDVKYIGGKFDYKVKYAFIQFYPKKPKRAKKKKSKKDNKFKSFKLKKKNKQNEVSKDKNVQEKSVKDNSTQETSKEKKSSNKSESQNLKTLDTLNLALDIFKTIKDKLGKFIKSVKITNLYIDFQVADLDACDCALKFGKINILLGNILGLLKWNFKVNKKSISVQPKYNSNDSVYDVSFKVKIGFGSGLGKILVMIFKVIPVLKENDIL